jgi:hypothetical protein
VIQVQSTCSALRIINTWFNAYDLCYAAVTATTSTVLNFLYMFLSNVAYAVTVNAATDSEHDDDAHHTVHDHNGDSATITTNTTSLRLRLVEQAAVIRHLELQLAAVTSETGAATAARHIASIVANAVGNRQSTNNTSISKNKANKQYTAATGVNTGSSDDINGKLQRVTLSA